MRCDENGQDDEGNCDCEKRMSGSWCEAQDCTLKGSSNKYMQLISLNHLVTYII